MTTANATNKIVFFVFPFFTERFSFSPNFGKIKRAVELSAAV